jgi:hypothetical protein
MNILLLDENDDTLENPALLEKIFEELTNKPIVKHINWEGSNIKIVLHWKRVHLEKKQSKFMGPLFIKSAYSDTALFDVTKAILGDIEQKFSNDSWKILFNIAQYWN